MILLDFSIIVASNFERNTIYETVDSIKQLDTASFVGEFILICNSNSQIRNIDFSHDSIQFKFLHEPKLGHSIAINRGIKNSCGELLLFTDDDVVLSRNWVRSYLEKFEDPRIGYLFGPISTVFEVTPPKDWSLLAPKYLSGMSLGADIIDFNEINKENDATGVNMAVNREIFKNGIIFNEGLGPSPITGNVGGADTLLGRQILQLNYICRYIPCALVYHFVEASRLSFLYLIKRKYKIGKTSLAYDFMHDASSTPPKLAYFLTSIIQNFITVMINLIMLRRVKMKISILKLARSCGSLSVYIFNRNYYESITKENYLFSSKRQM